MTEVFKLIQENPKEFIQTLREHFCKNNHYLANSHWDDFNGTDRYLTFFKKSIDDDIKGDEIWFDFEDDSEGSTILIMGLHIKKADGLLKFKGYVFPYILEFDWMD
jgi:hypothetical protein